MVSNFVVQRNLPIATADYLEPLFKSIFPDSKIDSSYSSARTKTTAIVNEDYGTHCHDFIVQHCENFPYSCGTDGGNDNGTYKMNPVSIYIYMVLTLLKSLLITITVLHDVKGTWCYS